MPDDREAMEAQRRHDLDLIRRHGAFRIFRVTFGSRRRGTVAIAPQIGRNNSKAFRQRRRDLVPHDMGLGISMQQ